MDPFRCLNRRRMLDDATRLRKIDMENKDLLKKINGINRMGVSKLLLPIEYILNLFMAIFALFKNKWD